jgi:plastocyanin
MGKGIIIGIIIGLIIIIILFFAFSIDLERLDKPSDNSQKPETGEVQLPTPAPNEILMSSSGFTPATLTTQIGETITFKAFDDSNRWPASDIHPSHINYPGSNINKCFTIEQNDIFDSCGGLLKGSTFKFTFTEPGTWKYHDHLQPSKKGMIIVE